MSRYISTNQYHGTPILVFYPEQERVENIAGIIGNASSPASGLFNSLLQRLLAGSQAGGYDAKDASPGHQDTYLEASVRHDTMFAGINVQRSVGHPNVSRIALRYCHINSGDLVREIALSSDDQGAVSLSFQGEHPNDEYFREPISNTATAEQVLFVAEMILGANPAPSDDQTKLRMMFGEQIEVNPVSRFKRFLPYSS